MVIGILADESLREEFLAAKVWGSAELVWADSVRSLGIIEADAYFDLLFNYDLERIQALRRLLPRPVFVNAVIHTLKDIGQPFTRINAWPTMLQRSVAEIVVHAGDSEATGLLDTLGWRYQTVPDTVGMVTPRIVSMVINEAWFTLGDGTSTKAEIDTAMKLGTNYPYGPFEWADKIGIANIKALLTELSRTDARYTIAPALMQEQSWG